MEEKNSAQSNQPEQPQKVNIEKYKDVEGLTTKRLNLGLWLVESRENFKKALIVFLIIVGIISWTYTIYGFGDYIARGMKEDDILAQKLAQVNTIGHDYILKKSAQDLIYSPIIVLKSNKNKYDFLIKAKNPNVSHWANFEYCFLAQGEEIDCAQGFILPGETKYLLSLAQEFKNKPVNIRLVTKDMRWSRINLHKFPDWNKFRNERLNFNIYDIKFKPAKSSGLSEKLNLNILEFTVANNSAYNYWEVAFNILLSNGDSIIAVNRYTLSEFMSGKKRQIKISWPGQLSQVSDTDIIPEINIVKDNIYIKYEGGVGKEK